MYISEFERRHRGDIRLSYSTIRTRARTLQSPSGCIARVHARLRRGTIASGDFTQPAVCLRLSAGEGGRGRARENEGGRGEPPASDKRVSRLVTDDPRPT